MSKKTVASESEIKKLYDPNTFYEHGDNPAFKKFMDIMVENVREGRLPDYRTYVVDKYKKLFEFSFIPSNPRQVHLCQKLGRFPPE